MIYVCIGELAMQIIVSKQFQKVSPGLWGSYQWPKFLALAQWRSYFICGGSKASET